MLELKGKYNTANIFADKIDDATKEQIQVMLNCPVFKNSYIAIMPDCHAGKGSVVGFTMKINDYLIPNVIGVDIGCGLLSVNIGKYDNIDFKVFDDFVKRNIPAGFKINEIPFCSYDYNRVFEDIEFWSSRYNFDFSYIERSIPSLGGGNHFIELGEDEDKNIWITVHSGSRKFGLQVAEYFQKKAVENLKTYFQVDPIFKGLEFLVKGSKEYECYERLSILAIEYAKINREIIIQKLLSFFNNTPILDKVHCIHNYIDFGDRIIRKGAISAHKDERVIIPFNMRDGLIIGRGKGSAKYNYSAPHGAGRVLSRKKAKDVLSVTTFKKEMQDANVYTTTAVQDTLDEAPNAYKDKNKIIENIKETVEIEKFIKPLYNFKGF